MQQQYYILKQSIKEVAPDMIINAVCNSLEVDKEDLTGKRVTADLREARRIAIALILIANPNLTLKQVGVMFGRNHTTIMYNRDEFDNQHGHDWDLTSKVKKVVCLL